MKLITTLPGAQSFDMMTEGAEMDTIQIFQGVHIVAIVADQQPKSRFREQKSVI